MDENVKFEPKEINPSNVSQTRPAWVLFCIKSLRVKLRS